MKWKTGNMGDRRVRKHFCVFPMEVEGHKVWLESVYAVEEYTGPDFGWWPKAWFLLKEKAEGNINTWYPPFHKKGFPHPVCPRTREPKPSPAPPSPND